MTVEALFETISQTVLIFGLRLQGSSRDLNSVTSTELLYDGRRPSAN